MRQYTNGADGEGVADARWLGLRLQQQTAYKPQLYALPWAFVQSSTLAQQESSLQLHAEKKALAVLLSHSEAELSVTINFNVCANCHDFFKISSQMLGRRI